MPITMTSPSNAYHLTLIFFFLSFLSFFFFKKKLFRVTKGLDIQMLSA